MEKTKKPHKKLRITLTIIAIIMLITGISLVLFPIISNTYGTVVANSIADTVDQRIENIKKIKKNPKLKKSLPKDDGINYDNVDIDALEKASKEYNKKLINNQRNLVVTDFDFGKAVLDLKKYGINDGVYGYIKASSINMKLPVYLGASNANMAYGAAHLTYTSLPIGTKRSNAVIAGHTGYIGRIFFDNIRNLKIGDKVTMVTYWKNINYKVTGTKIIKPQQADDLFINDNIDRLILVTCISNGSGGFNRYLVFCDR